MHPSVFIPPSSSPQPCTHYPFRCISEIFGVMLNHVFHLMTLFKILKTRNWNSVGKCRKCRREDILIHYSPKSLRFYFSQECVYGVGCFLLHGPWKSPMRPNLSSAKIQLLTKNFNALSLISTQIKLFLPPNSFQPWNLQQCSQCSRWQSRHSLALLFGLFNVLSVTHSERFGIHFPHLNCLHPVMDGGVEGKEVGMRRGRQGSQVKAFLFSVRWCRSDCSYN